MTAPAGAAVNHATEQEPGTPQHAAEEPGQVAARPIALWAVQYGDDVNTVTPAPTAAKARERADLYNASGSEWRATAVRWTGTAAAHAHALTLLDQSGVQPGGPTAEQLAALAEAALNKRFLYPYPEFKDQARRAGWTVEEVDHGVLDDDELHDLAEYGIRSAHVVDLRMIGPAGQLLVGRAAAATVNGAGGHFRWVAVRYWASERDADGHLRGAPWRFLRALKYIKENPAQPVDGAP